jgi:hypothetical protein
MLPTFTLPAAASAIRARLAANAAADVDRIARITLDRLSARLRRELAAAENPLNPAHLFNENWRGPALASLLDQCEAAVRMGAMEDAA